MLSIGMAEQSKKHSGESREGRVLVSPAIGGRTLRHRRRLKNAGLLRLGSRDYKRLTETSTGVAKGTRSSCGSVLSNGMNNLPSL